MSQGRNGLATSSSDVLRTEFDTVRDDLLTSGLYLGDQNFEIDRVIWRRIGFDNCLVTKESADAVDAAHAAMKTEPGEDGTLSPIPEYDPAVLSAVVHISNDDFWMTSCGHWRGATQFCPRFSDVKLTCTGKSPSETPFRKDFPAVLANLTAVANLPARFTNKKGLFVERLFERKIKFRHVLFEVSIRLPSLLKPQLINLIMNRGCPKRKQNHLGQKPHQKATVSISNTTILIAYTYGTNFLVPCFRAPSRVPHRELAM